MSIDVNFLSDLLAMTQLFKEIGEGGEGEVTYPCLLCGRIYKHKGNLAKHKRYECGVEPRFACYLCSYRAKQKTALHSHLRNKHNWNN